VTQLDLFASNQEIDFSEDRKLAAQLPSGVYFGTSSWTFPGWSGICYPQGTTLAELRRRGLELYSKHPLLRTVGIDSSYYRPLDRPALRSYATQLPDGFLCVSKVYSAITTRCDPQTLAPNPTYLDPSAFESDVLRPIGESFAEHQGPLVLEFPDQPHAPPIAPRDFNRLLTGFFSAASNQFKYSVELRDRSLLSQEYFDTLQRFGVAHVLNFWERMPQLGEQFDAGADTSSFGVLRLLIPPGQRYATRKRTLEPFDRIVEVQRRMRDDTLAIVRYFAQLNKPVFVIVNNKAEGCSPLTVKALAQELVGSP